MAKKDCPSSTAKCGGRPAIGCPDASCTKGWTIEKADDSIEITYDTKNCKVLISAKQLYTPPAPCCPTTVPGEPGIEGPKGESIVGEKGDKGDTGAGAVPDDGADGQSAYDIAVANGFTGTEAEWLESLKGSPGTGASSPTGRVKYIRHSIITCTPTSGLSLINTQQLMTAWVESSSASGPFFVFAWGPGVTSPTAPVATLPAAIALADSMVGSFTCPEEAGP